MAATTFTTSTSSHRTTNLILPRNSTSRHNRFTFTKRLSFLSSPHTLHSYSLSSFPPPRVSTTSVDYAPPEPDLVFRREIIRLRRLRARISDAETIDAKLRVLDRDSRVRGVFGTGRRGKGFGKVVEEVGLGEYEVFLLKCMVAAGQEHVLGLEEEVGVSARESSRSSLRSVVYGLAVMIEKLDAGGGKGGEGEGGRGRLEDARVLALRNLVKTLDEIEKFYDCIGGVIG